MLARDAAAFVVYKNGAKVMYIELTVDIAAFIVQREWSKIYVNEATF